MRLSQRIYLWCYLCSILGLSITAQNFGSLVLCPPGGQSFATAYMMACEVKKRRRKKRDSGSLMRPATLKEVQNICCEVGCELRDLLNYCDPFGWFDS
uniref:Insulin-like domain-containing protein n=1 Tax=Wuchereria bancrofti TaxID=6293 RepID=A0AAF5Q0E1_WUCBA